MKNKDIYRTSRQTDRQTDVQTDREVRILWYPRGKFDLI